MAHDHTPDELEITLGRRAPFTQVGDWVMLANIRHASKVLYWALSAHINSGRRREGDTDVWPTQEALAQMLGYSRADKVRPLLEELVAIDAIEIQKVPVPKGGNRERSIYTVHQTPPPGFVGLESLAEFHAARRAAAGSPQTGSRDPKWGAGASNGVPARDPKWGPGGASNGVPNQTNTNPDELNKEGGCVSGVRHHARASEEIPSPLPAESVEPESEPVSVDATDPPPPWCPDHPGNPGDVKCGRCKAHRLEREAFNERAAHARAEAERQQIAARRRAEANAIAECGMCDAEGFIPGERAVKCLHDPRAIETAREGSAKVRAVLAAKTRRHSTNPQPAPSGASTTRTAPKAAPVGANQ